MTMTKRFTYTDEDNIIKEGDGFLASEFVTTATPNSPVITTPTGQFDISLIPEKKAARAATLTVLRKAAGTVYKGELVRSTTLNHVAYADPTMTITEATVLGVAMNDAVNEEDVEVLVFGVYSNDQFTIFAVNATLFLDEMGGFTDVRPLRPSKKYLTVIGKSLGGHDVLINIQPPTTLGA